MIDNMKMQNNMNAWKSFDLINIWL